jgi:hypothetical protein
VGKPKTAPEPWRSIWRNGIAPSLHQRHLEALRRGLESNDSALIHKQSFEPIPLPCIKDFPVHAACALGYPGWKGDRLETVGEAEEFFSRVIHETEERLGEVGAVDLFLRWWDYGQVEAGGVCVHSQTERRRLLLEEVELALESF